MVRRVLQVFLFENYYSSGIYHTYNPCFFSVWPRILSFIAETHLTLTNYSGIKVLTSFNLFKFAISGIITAPFKQFADPVWFIFFLKLTKEREKRLDNNVFEEGKIKSIFVEWENNVQNDFKILRY